MSDGWPCRQGTSLSVLCDPLMSAPIKPIIGFAVAVPIEGVRAAVE